MATESEAGNGANWPLPYLQFSVFAALTIIRFLLFPCAIGLLLPLGRSRQHLYLLCWSHCEKTPCLFSMQDILHEKRGWMDRRAENKGVGKERKGFHKRICAAATSFLWEAWPISTQTSRSNTSLIVDLGCQGRNTINVLLVMLANLAKLFWNYF